MQRPARLRSEGALLCALPILLSPLATSAVTIVGSQTLVADVTDGVDATGAAGEVLTIAPGVSITGSVGALGPTVNVGSAGYDVVNGGDIDSPALIGVEFDEAGSTLTNDGTIDGGLSAVSFLMDGSVENNGTITGGSGLSFAGSGSVTNTGTIETATRPIDFEAGGTLTNEADGVLLATNGTAIRASTTANDVSVINRGTITSETTGAGPFTAIELRSTGDNIFTNEGDVTAPFDAVVIGGPASASNSGSIESTGGSGVVLEGSGSFVNGGTVTATSVGIQVDASASVTNDNAVTSTGAEGVRLDGSGSLTNTGTITGATQAVLVTADGDVTNRGSLVAGSGPAVSFTGSAANTYTHAGSVTTPGIGVEMGAGDDLAVLQTTLAAGVDGGAGTDTLRLEGDGSLGNESPNFELLVVDAGTWTIFGDLAVTDTQLDAGNLRVSGSLAGTLAVNAGGTLLGNGSVGDVTNRGRVAPGDSIGTLSAASYTQEAGGELVIEVSNAGADQLAVAGDADLAGTLTLAPVLPLTTAGPFDIVTAGNLGPGQFDAIAASPLLATDLQYTAGLGGRVTLTVALADSFASAAATANQAAVAGAVDALFDTATGDLADVLGGLLALPSPAALQDGFDQLSPEPLGATAQVIFTGAQWHAAMLTDHLRDLRLGIAPEAPLAARGGALPAAALALANPRERREPGVFALRANAYGVYSDLDGGSAHTGHDAFGGVFGLGADTWLSERLVLGGDLSAGYTRIESERDDADVDDLFGRLTGFGSLDLGAGYVDGLASYAFHWLDGHRRIRYDGIDRGARSDHTAHELSAYLGTGLELSRGGFDFGPEASGQYTLLLEEGYRESSAGTAALRIDEREPDSLATRLGIRVSRRWQVDPETVLVPRLRLGWAHEWLDTSQALRASFSSPGAPEFEVRSRSLSRDSLVARIGVRALLRDDIVVEGDYGIDVGRSATMSHQLGIVLRAAF